MGVSFHLASRGDAERMTRFHNDYYGSHRRAPFWDWLYYGWKPDRAVFAFAVSDDGRIIATQGMVPYPLSVMGSEVLSSKSESTLMLPEGRGSGLMGDLYEYAFLAATERGSEVVWGFTDSDRAFQRFGFQTTPVGLTYERLGRSLVRGALGRLQAADSARHRFMSMSRHLQRMLTRRPSALPSSGTVDLSTVTLPVAREAWCRLVSTADAGGVTLAADPSYFDWRWGANPSTRFAFLQSLTEGGSEGVAVLSQAAGRTAISDIQTHDSNGSSVLSSIVTLLARRTGAFRAYVNELANEGTDARTLDALGFELLSRTNLVVRTAPSASRPVLDQPESWKFSYAWTEGVGV